MKPRIEILPEKKVVGIRLNMSLAKDQTRALWMSFSPRKKEIKNLMGSELLSIEIYSNPDFFINFSPEKEFEKWAALEVQSFEGVPIGMETLVIPEGLYAVFHYKGKPSEAKGTFQHIYGIWLPNSEYDLDQRPHFALMGDKYKGEDPESEEEFWIPIRNK